MSGSGVRSWVPLWGDKGGGGGLGRFRSHLNRAVMVTPPEGSEPRIVIIGAGPTGLGAGYRLQELGYSDWVVLEASDHVGGLATSFQDDAGFTYDIGGHVMFSHYGYWDDVVDKLLGDDYTELTREAWVWT